jgi:predicted house-cleaning NTP pyrophosphatase (Maf/HAM1 superfamily)
MAKAQAVAQLHPGAIVIGSDQVPELDGQPLSKPGTHERATEQLRQMSGRQMNFHTGVCVSCAETGFSESSVVTVQVRFRELNDPRSSAICAPSSPMTAQARPRAKAWASPCWMPSSATTPRH